jgi:hypothetical protein
MSAALRGVATATEQPTNAAGQAAQSNRSKTMRSISVRLDQKRSSLLLAVVAAVVVLAMTVGSPPAPAASKGCTLEALTPLHWGGNKIAAFARGKDCGGTARLVLQRSVLWGSWRDVVSRTISANGALSVLNYNCRGTGTRKYRSYVDAHTAGGKYKSDGSNTIKITC